MRLLFAAATFLSSLLLAHHDTAAAATTLNLVAIGDSLTATGSTAPDGWVGVLAADIDVQINTTTEVTNLGRNNAMSGDLLSLTEGDATFRSALRTADVVTYQAGINDFLQARARFLFGICGGIDNEDCLRDMVTSFAANWDAIVEDIAAVAPYAALRTMDVYYPVAAYDQSLGVFGTLDSYLTEMNAHIANHSRGLVADVHASFNGNDGTEDPIAKGYILLDAIHPTWLGHMVMYFRVKALGYQDIVPRAVGVGGVARPSSLDVDGRGGTGHPTTSRAYIAASVTLVALGLGAAASSASGRIQLRRRRRANDDQPPP